MMVMLGHDLGSLVLLLAIVTCDVRAQLDPLPGGGCVTGEGFLGDCIPAGECPESSPSPCRTGMVCCTRISGAPTETSQEVRPVQVPPSGSLVFSGPDRPAQQERPTLLNPPFECGGRQGQSRRRRQATKRPFIVGGSAVPADLGAGLGVVSTSSPPRPALNSVLQRIDSRPQAELPPSRPSPSRTPSAPSFDFSPPPSPARTGRTGFSSSLPFSPPRRQLSRNPFRATFNRRPSPQRRGFFRDPPSQEFKYTGPKIKTRYQTGVGRSGHYYRPRRPRNFFESLGRALSGLFAPLFRRRRWRRDLNPISHTFHDVRLSSFPRYTNRRPRRSPAPQEPEDPHFEALWREYQRRVQAGQAQSGISRDALRKAYQAAAAVEPDQTAGGDQRAWTCGAVLVSDRYMLTAAHCLQAGTPQVVRLGDRVLNSSSEASAPAEYRVIEVIPHPDYSAAYVYHDLALLRLDRMVTFGPHVKPFCLFDSSFSLVDKVGYVSGWGATEYGGGLVNTLMGGNLTIWERSRCDRVYSNIPGQRRKLPQGITRGILCAGGGIRDACQGDSGGPMTVLTDKGTRLVGIVSAGVGCATEGVPGLYTDVSEYIDWIDSVVFGGE